MTGIDRPHLTLQQRYMQLLALAEEFNAGEVYVSAVDWHVLLQCTPSRDTSRDATGQSMLIYGRRFRLKTPAKPPHGVLDLTGETPSFEP
jgi:hypothetical protein